MTKAIRLNPGYTAAYTNRGLAFEKKGDFISARQDFEQALATSRKYSNGAWAHRTARARLRALEEKLRRRSRPATVASAGPAAAPLPTVSLRRRVALVIGNSHYANEARLYNPSRDAKALAKAFRHLGFTVMEKYDLDYQGLRRALLAFGRKALAADWALVYFSGHGVAVDGVTYLVPVDAALVSVIDVADEALPLTRVMDKVGYAKKLGLVIVDACRNNPLAKSMSVAGQSKSVAKGLGRVEPEGNVLVAYAAKNGQVAFDGDGPSSPYVQALLEVLEREPGLEIGLFFRKVRDRVRQLTGGKQTPYTYGSLPARAYAFKAQ